MTIKFVRLIVILSMLFSLASTAVPVHASAGQPSNVENLDAYRPITSGAANWPKMQAAPNPEQVLGGSQGPVAITTPFPILSLASSKELSLGFGTGIYDDTQIGINWSGNWTSVNANNALGGSYRSSTTVGNSATFQYTGSQFSLLFIKAPNRGSVQIKIDNNIVATFSMAASTVQWSQKWDTPIQSDSGPHTVTITHIGGGEIVFDGFQISDPDPSSPLTPGYYEDNSGFLEYSGVWVDYSAASASAGNVHYSTSIGSSLNFTFSGNQFSVIYTGLSNRGILSVYVDGVLIGSVNEYSAQTAWQQRWTSPLLQGSDAHTVELKHSSGAVVEIDAIEIFNVTLPDSVGPGTYEDNDANLTYAGQWLSATPGLASGGSVRYSMVTENSVSLRFTGNQFTLVYTGFPNRGVMGVFINGQQIGAINQYSSTTSYQNRWTSPILSDTGPHTLEFKHISGSVVELDAVIISNSTAVGPGTYESNSINFNYIGQWLSATPSGASANEVSYSTVIGNKAVLRFVGNQIRLLYTGLSNRGVMGVYINGELVGSVNQYSATTTFQKSWTSSVLSNTGPHTLELRHASGAVVELDAVVVVENDPLVAGKYENNDPNLTYTGLWTDATASSASGGSVRYSTTVGNSVALRFAGNQVSLIYTGYPNRGVMGVYIDGQFTGSVNQYSATTSWQKRWNSLVLNNPGPHTLEFRHESGQVVELDAVIISSSAPPTVTPTPTESPIFYPPDGKEMYRASFAPNNSGNLPSSIPANHDSYGVSISGNGRYTAFSSLASNLIFENNVCGSTGRSEIYLHDRQTGKNQCISVLFGVAVDGESVDPFVSSSGQYVVFASKASNFSSGVAPANVKQIYVWHKTSGTISAVSLSDNGDFADGDCFDPSITPDGKYIVFYSNATNLVDDDDNGKTDVFLRDMGDLGGDGSYSGSNQQTIMISRTTQGGPLVPGVLGSSGSFVSDDGQRVAFTSDSPDLTGDVSGSITQAFLHDRTTGTNFVVSAISDGADGKIFGNGSSRVFGLSRDGQFVFFYSTASNLVAGGDSVEDAYVYDVELDTITQISLPEGQSIEPFPAVAEGKLLFETSKALMAADTNGVKDVYMRLADGTLELISLPVGATNTGVYSSHSAVLSRDGRYVVFQSSVNALDPVDTPPPGGEPILENVYIRAIDESVLILDIIAPAAVTDFDADPGSEEGEVFLSWTATGDDGMTGTASSYDIRYSLYPISSEEDWDNATKVSNIQLPDGPGSFETLVVSGLERGKIYYFAMKVADEVPNWSELSNITSAMTPGISDSGVGLYEDNSGVIAYAGSWVSFGSERASGGNVHYSTTPGSTATIHFAGNKVSIIYTGLSNRGILNVYIDGILIGSVNEYSATAAFQQRWTSPVLEESGSHVLELRHASGAVVEIDAVEIFDVPAPAPLDPGMYQDDEVDLVYSGDWMSSSSSSASGGSVRYSTTVGNQISTRFRGNQVKVIYTGLPNRGIMGIYVDGQKIGTLNQYSAQLAWQRQWKSPILQSSGTHTLELKHESGQVVELDALTILEIAPVEPGVYEENNENFNYEGDWKSATPADASGGSVRYSTKAGNKIVLRFTGNQISVVYTGLHNRGVMGVYVDGNKIGSINEYEATTAWQKRWYSPLLSDSGPHLLELVHESGPVVELDALVVLNREPSGAGTYQDDDPNLGYAGPWLFANPAEASGGSVRYSMTKGNSVSFLFTGTKLSLVYTGMGNRGIVGVYINGALVGTVDEFRNELSWQQVWTSPTLPNSGPHALELRHESGQVIELDALIIE